ncbi:MAG: hypothetical protein GX102_14985 [Porphyromonadaceae bacterium]|jgi:5-methyltetrahydrofolate--homocysteine methyltransferase|nr:hypothetical protein [Porphyromonadaceae bacterium]
MSYTPVKPNQTGIHYFFDLDLNEMITFIDWRFYFLVWRLTGRFEAIESVEKTQAAEAEWINAFKEEDRPKAAEAMKLFRDTEVLLKEIIDKKLVTLNAGYSIFPAYSDGDDIVVIKDNQEIRIPTLRQQKPGNDGFCYSLADFLAPENDYIGVFANTVIGPEELSKKYEEEGDVYKSILIKTIADRLGEATAEWLHWKVRKEFWGYAPDEDLTISEMHKTYFKGIRPAVGYPSMPDQSIIFDIDPLLHFDKVGITLTENGAMYPNASVSGLYFAHPKSKYFMIGKIDDEQLADYAKRKGKAVEEIKKWMIANI